MNAKANINFLRLCTTGSYTESKKIYFTKNLPITEGTATLLKDSPE